LSKEPLDSGSSVERYGRIRELVQRELASSAHDMEHVERVYRLCLHIAHDESDVDLDVLRTAALLHDIARVREDRDNSRNIDRAILGAETAGSILRDLGDSEDRIERVKHCVMAHRFRSTTEAKTKEAKILSDADKLDVLGAIGVARSFMIAGQYGQRIFSDAPVEEYTKNNLADGKPIGRIKDVSQHAPNLEFETKFRYIPNRLHTGKAKEIAKDRMRFMVKFFERLQREIQGEE
jgi:uncharacterized protein